MCLWGKGKNNMTKSLKWRLSKLPTPSELTELVSNKIITPAEAKEILLSEEEKTERDVKSLEEEIKFLRELVEKLSDNKSTTIVKQIEYIQPAYRQYNWYRPYENWCGGSQGALTHGGMLYPANETTLSTYSPLDTNCSFSSIKTF